MLRRFLKVGRASYPVSTYLRYLKYSQFVNWTPDSFSPAIQHVGINHGSPDIFVAKEFLYGSDVIAVLEKMRCKRMSQCVACGPFVYSCSSNSPANGFLNDRFVNMMPPLHTRSGIHPSVLLWK